MAVRRDGTSLTYESLRTGAIDAPARDVWPWLIQMGYDRGGWYAIDRLEKLLGVGRFATGTSAKRVVAELQNIDVGDRIPLSRRRWLDVTVCDAPSRLLLTLPKSRFLAWTWEFQLTETAPAVTRLRITTTMSVPASNPLKRAVVRVIYRVFHVGHGLMERVQLRTLAKRVPGSTR